MWFPYIRDVLKAVNVSSDDNFYLKSTVSQTEDQWCRLCSVTSWTALVSVSCLRSEVTRAAPYFVVLRLMLMTKTFSFIFDI